MEDLTHLKIECHNFPENMTVKPQIQSVLRNCYRTELAPGVNEPQLYQPRALMMSLILANVQFRAHKTKMKFAFKLLAGLMNDFKRETMARSRSLHRWRKQKLLRSSHSSDRKADKTREKALVTETLERRTKKILFSKVFLHLRTLTRMRKSLNIFRKLVSRKMSTVLNNFTGDLSSGLPCESEMELRAKLEFPEECAARTVFCPLLTDCTSEVPMEELSIGRTSYAQRRCFREITNQPQDTSKHKEITLIVSFSYNLENHYQRRTFKLECGILLRRIKKISRKALTVPFKTLLEESKKQRQVNSLIDTVNKLTLRQPFHYIKASNIEGNELAITSLYRKKRIIQLLILLTRIHSRLQFSQNALALEAMKSIKKYILSKEMLYKVEALARHRKHRSIQCTLKLSITKWKSQVTQNDRSLNRRKPNRMRKSAFLLSQNIAKYIAMKMKKIIDKIRNRQIQTVFTVLSAKDIQFSSNSTIYATPSPFLSHKWKPPCFSRSSRSDSVLSESLMEKKVLNLGDSFTGDSSFQARAIDGLFKEKKSIDEYIDYLWSD